MRILFLSHYTELLGANRSLLGLVRYLHTQNVNVSVVLPDEGDVLCELESANVPCIISPIPIQLIHSDQRPSRINLWRFNRWQQSTTLNARRESQDAARAIRSKLAGKFDLIYTNSTATRVGVELAEQLSIPHVWHLREFPENYAMQYAGGRKEFASLARRSAACVAISHAVKHALFASPYTHPRCEVVYNGVIERGQLPEVRRNAPSYSAKFRLLLLGHVFRSKGHDLAISALSQLIRARSLTTDQVELRIVGPGDHKWATDLTNAHFVADYVSVEGPTATPFAEIRKADCLLMCSHREAFGRVTAEAMANGTPVIAVDDGAGSAEIIQHGVDGYLCERTPMALADSIWRLMQDLNLYSQLRTGGIRRAAREFTVEAYGGKVLEIIRSVVPQTVDSHESAN